ncbi:MAG: VWA domain-containing protein [Myxococcota bacterium]
MTLLSPWSLAWLGLLVPLVVLYILKRRRETKVIGSTILWEQALRDLRAEKPWKRLIPQVSLLLQALAIIAGAIALARPAGIGGVPRGALVAVVIDSSASMAATYEGASRLSQAQEVATAVAESLPPGGRMMLIEAAREPSVLLPPTADRGSLQQAIDGLKVRGGSAALEAAVALAAERLRDAPEGSRVLLLTDAAEDGDVALDARVPVELRRVGGPDDAPVDNTAIVDADVRARPEEGADRADVFVRLERVGAEPVDVFVTASIEGREGVVASRRVTVEGDGTESVVMSANLPPDPNGNAAVVRVAISRAAGGAGMDDDLSLDDLAVVPSPGSRRLPVFLVGTAPTSVERVLRSDARVELFATTLARIEEREDEGPLDGLFIYTGDLPERPPPGDSVVIAPIADEVFEVRAGEEVASPRIVTWDEGDARLRFVNLSEVHFAAIRPLQGGAGRALVETDGGVALSSIQRPDGETTVLSFNPDRSDWPRQTSFVVFFRNLLERARNRRAAGGVAPGSLGEALRIAAADGEEVVVTTPSGDRTSAYSRGGVAVVPVVAEPGVYQVVAEGRPRHALRSLLDRSESNIRPRARFLEGGAATEGQLAEVEEHAESWPWIAGLLLLVLGLETWWATRRRATA